MGGGGRKSSGKFWAAECTAPFNVMSDTAQEFIAFGRTYRSNMTL